MAEYKAGQRVRITYPTGTVVEAVLSNRGSACLGYHLNEAEYMERVIEPDGSKTRDCTIEVLSEPRPEEPDGLGAVVEALFHSPGMVGESRQVWVRRVLSPVHSTKVEQKWVSEDARWHAAWEYLEDPVVLSEGWHRG